MSVPGCVVGDKIRVTCHACWERELNLSKAFTMYLDATDNADGASPGVQTHIPGAIWEAANGIDANDGDDLWPVSLSGVWTVTVAGTTDIVFAFIGATLSGTDRFKLWPGFSLTAIRYPA